MIIMNIVPLLETWVPVSVLCVAVVVVVVVVVDVDVTCRDDARNDLIQYPTCDPSI